MRRTSLITTGGTLKNIRDTRRPSLWLKADAGITMDTSNRVSLWADQSGNSRNFTQSTAANKPIFSRADNLENRLGCTNALADAYWTPYLCTITTSVDDAFGGTSAVSIIPNAGTNNAALDHSLGDNSIPVPPSTQMRRSCYLKSTGADKYAHLRTLYRNSAGSSSGTTANCWIKLSDMTFGTKTNCTATIESVGSGWYKVTQISTSDATTTQANINAAGCSDADNSLAATGDASAFVSICGPQLSVSSADDTYLPNPLSVPQYRGLNGCSAVVFDGSSRVMTSTAQYSAVTTTAAHTAFYVYTSPATSSEYIMSDANGSHFIAVTATNKFRVINWDGSNQPVIDRAASAQNKPTIGATWHTGGVLYASANNAAAGSSTLNNLVNSGAALRIGNFGSGYFNGMICEIVIFPFALTAAERATWYYYLRSRWGV